MERERDGDRKGNKEKRDRFMRKFTWSSVRIRRRSSKNGMVHCDKLKSDQFPKSFPQKHVISKFDLK